MVWLKNLIEILAVIVISFDELFDRIGDLFGDLWDAFPNLIAMADALVRFFTGILGVFVGNSSTLYWTLASKGMERGVATREQGLPFQHVMTPSQALAWVAVMSGEMIKLVTGTRDQGLVEFIIQHLGMWVYRMFKRFSLILDLIGIKSEADAVKLFKRILDTKSGTLLIYAVIAGLAFLLWASVLMTGVLVFIASSWVVPRAWEDHVLFSQHKRQKERVKISRRIGGVVP